MKRKDINTIKKEIKLINPNISINNESDYKNMGAKMSFHCNKHEYDFEATARTFIIKKSLGCYYCKTEAGKYGGQHIPIEEVKNTVEKRGYIFKDILYKDKKCYVDFICSSHSNKGKQTISFGNFKKSKCPCCYCNGTNRTTEDFIHIINDKFHNNIEILSKYTGAKNRVICRCVKHDYSWQPFAYNLLSGCGCPICGNEQIGLKRRLSYEEKYNKLTELHPEINILKMSNTTKDKVTCQCKKCNYVWKATYANLTNPLLLTGCPACNESKGEKKIGQILDSLNILYIPQYTFEDCKDVKPLPFDFYLSDYNTVIEYDGEFHFIEKYDDERFSAKERLNYIKYHDDIKTLYCINNSINLIRIPYWDYDKIEEYICIEKLSA